MREESLIKRGSLGQKTDQKTGIDKIDKLYRGQRSWGEGSPV